MDTKGNIYALPPEIMAQFTDKLHGLSDAEAEELAKIPEDERLKKLELLRKHPLTAIGDLDDAEARKLREEARKLRDAVGAAQRKV
jgi:hypothetical protein